MWQRRFNRPVSQPRCFMNGPLTPTLSPSAGERRVAAAGSRRLFASLVFVALAGFFLEPAPGQSGNLVSTSNSSRYETRAEHDRDGIGKFYMGREIARVMGHEAADWLERTERADEERPDLLLKAL